jgi:hypothetical protein
MAVKKKSGGTATKAAPKRAAGAGAGSGAGASAKKSSTKAAAGTGTKTGTPKKAAAAQSAAPKTKAKKAAPVKLTDKQSEFLRTIHSAGEGGYRADKKGESKALESLLGKKLIKRGAKDKASGVYSYSVSKAGEKHIASSGSTNPSSGG